MNLCKECNLRPIIHQKEKLCKKCYKRLILPDKGICIRCEIRPVEHLKRQLCASCYRYLRRNNELGGPLDPIVGRELEFADNYFTHSDWLYQPATFKFSGVYYTPDFYDSMRNVFIEVAGSRQAYHANKHKYSLFRKSFPKLLFEIRKPSGTLIDDLGRINWKD